MQTAIQYIRTTLADLYTGEEINSLSRLILSAVTGWNYTAILVNKDTVFSENQRETLENYVEKLKAGMPVQYVLGETEFCGLNFKVNESVLIPRPETEELVEWVRESAMPGMKILDIGTGSGCIPVSLKYFLPECLLFACDISQNALEIASVNAKLNQSDVHFFQKDILNYTDDALTYDIIVSNPPYIPASEIEQIHTNVKDFEPHLALFVPDEDPLIFYRIIAHYALNHLEINGFIFFEIHYTKAEDISEMLENFGFRDVIVRKDIFGKARMIRCKK
jgi:release factor glutamine methyltransferase